MEAILVSALVVAVAEIGDKTQILALVLAARFRQPLPILSGIGAATLANHAAAVSGAWLAALIGPEALRWALGLLFIALAVWTLKPDRLDHVPASTSDRGAFGISLVSFFVAEIADKTQIATVGLAASFESVTAVVVGTVCGMMAANAPVIFIGAAANERVPLRVVRFVAAGLFVVMGLFVLAGVDLPVSQAVLPNAR